MHFRDYIAIVERYHSIQNPTSVENLDLLADYCAIRDGIRILDVGCGKAWLLRRWASRFDIHATGLEINSHFAAEAKAHVAEQGLSGRVEIVEGPALKFSAENAGFDLVLCIGASFALGGFDAAIKWMSGKVVDGGIAAIGDLFAKQLPLPEEMAADYADAARSLTATVEKLRFNELLLRGLIPSSIEDWDRYESLHWRAVDKWASQNPSHPDRQQVLDWNEKFRMRYLAYERPFLGWAIFVCTKRGS